MTPMCRPRYIKCMSNAPAAADIDTIKIMGTTDTAPVDGCEHCQRANLKTYIVVLHDGDLHYYGTTCGPKVYGLAWKAALKDWKAEVAAADTAAREAAHAAADARYNAFNNWMADQTGGLRDREAMVALGGPAAANAAYRAATA